MGLGQGVEVRLGRVNLVAGVVQDAGDRARARAGSTVSIFRLHNRGRPRDLVADLDLVVDDDGGLGEPIEPSSLVAFSARTPSLRSANWPERRRTSVVMAP